MGVRTDQLSARAVYLNALQICRDAKVDPVAAALTQSTLRSEILLSTGQTHYQFGVTVLDPGYNNNGAFNTEIRLGQQNSFIVSQIAFFLAEPASATDASYIDYAYPNPSVFSASNEAQALWTLYKSYLKITVNNVVKVPSLHLGRFSNVPQSQKVAAAANQNGIGNDQRDGSTDATMVCEPNLVLIGSKANLVELFMPAALAAVGTGGFTRAIIEWRGILAQNSTIIV